MRKIKLTALAGALIIPLCLGSLVSCNNDDDPIIPVKPVELEADVPSLEFPAYVDSGKTINVTGPDQWTFSVDERHQSWVKVVRDGNKLNVTVTDNIDGGMRDGIITLSSPLEDVKDLLIPVSQQADTQEYQSLVANSGVYSGDSHGTGTGYFAFTMADSKSPQTTLYLRGYVPLLNDGEEFELPSGIYTVDENNEGKAGTFVKGYMNSSKQLDGCLLVIKAENESESEYIYITGGTFTVSSDGGVYTIVTDLEGIDVDTDEKVTGLRYKHTGMIDFANRVPVIHNVTATKMHVEYRGNDYGTKDDAGQYFMYLYVGKTDSGGSMIAPYSRLVVEFYAPQSSNGYPPAGTYNSQQYAYWVPFKFLPAYVSNQLEGTYYEFYGAADPTTPERIISVSSGSYEITVNGNEYTLNTNLNGLPFYPTQTNQAQNLQIDFTGRPTVRDRS